MSTEKWQVRKHVPNSSAASWYVIPPAGAETSFPWYGSPEEVLGGRWSFPFGAYWRACIALRWHLDSETERAELGSLGT